MGLGKCISCFEYGHSGYLNVKFQVVYFRDFLEIKRGISLEDFAPSRSATKPQTLITKCYHFRPLRNATNLQFSSSNSISHISRWDQHSKLFFSKNQVCTFFSTHFFLETSSPSSHILPPRSQVSEITQPIQVGSWSRSSPKKNTMFQVSNHLIERRKSSWDLLNKHLKSNRKLKVLWDSSIIWFWCILHMFYFSPSKGRRANKTKLKSVKNHQKSIRASIPVASEPQHATVSHFGIWLWGTWKKKAGSFHPSNPMDPSLETMEV